GSVNEFWLNDAHAALMGLWHKIIHDPDGLALDYMTLWQSQNGRERNFYNQVRSDFNASQKPELLLFLLARCVKAAIRYNRRGEFNNSPDHRRKGMMPSTMQETLRHVSEALGRGTRLTSTDYKQVLAKTTTSDFVFMDPPYQGVAKQRDNRYISGVDFDEFVCELESLNKREIPFAVSYDGRTGGKIHGRKLPDYLQLYHVEMLVG
ncbi:DNA adenine methylase, partial [mine drainage metagenome]